MSHQLFFEVFSAFCISFVLNTLLKNKIKTLTNFWKTREKYLIIRASAPGKIILSGEHAVTFGKPALATAIDKRTQVSISHQSCRFHHQHPCFILHSLDIQLAWTIQNLMHQSTKLLSPTTSSFDISKHSISHGDFSPDFKSIPLLEDSHLQMAQVFLFLILKQGIVRKLSLVKTAQHDVVVQVSSDIPTGVGLGSSAAYSVALSAATHRYRMYLSRESKNKSYYELMRFNAWEVEEVQRMSYESEMVFHGNPSGIDNAVSMLGGYVFFESREKLSQVELKELELWVIDTKVVGSTSALVAQVRRLRCELTEVAESVLDAIGKVTAELMECLRGGEGVEVRVRRLFEVNHGLLVSLGVGHKDVARVLSICLECGVKGMKITGAGGGGCVILPVMNTDVEVMNTDWRVQCVPGED